MKRLIIAAVCITLIGCKKDATSGFYTIQGQILESSSNPVPAKYYELNFYQKALQALLGGISGIDQVIKTDNNGNFLLKYDPAKNYGLSGNGINDNTISFYGVDTIQYRGLYPHWAPVPSAINTNLGKLYLYKKIDNLIRKIKFDNSLNAGENMDILTTNGYASNRRTLTGPIAAGTLLIVDTIRTCRLVFFNLSNKTYSLSFTLLKPQFEKDTAYILPVGDETQLAVQITY